MGVSDMTVSYHKTTRALQVTIVNFFEKTACNISISWKILNGIRADSAQSTSTPDMLDVFHLLPETIPG